MKRKISENIEHRGNDQNVTSRMLLELQLIRNMNQKDPVYSFEKEKPERENK